MGKENVDTKIIFIYLYTTFIILVMLGNTSVFITYYRMKTDLKKKLPNFLLLHQAIVDFFIAVCTVPYVFCFADHCLTSTFYTNKFFSEYTIYLAVGTLIVCTTERFLCVQHPMYHHAYATKGKIAQVLAFTWLITLIPGFVHISHVLHTSTRLWAYYITNAVVLLLGVSIVFGLLVATYHVISQSINNKIAEAKMSGESMYMDRIASRRIAKEERKLNMTIRVFLLMAVIYTLTILPSITGQIITESLRLPRQTNFVVKRSLYLFYMASSLVNPFLTLKFKADFTNTVRECFRKRNSKAMSRPITRDTGV